MSDRRSIVLGVFVNIAISAILVAISTLLLFLFLDPSELQKQDTQIIIAVNVVIVLFLFNLYKYSSFKTLRKTDKGWRKLVLIHSIMSDIIRGKKIIAKLMNCLTIRSNEKRLEAEQKALDNVSKTFTLEAIKKMPENEIKKQCKEIGLNWFGTWWLLRTIRKIKAGKIYSVVYTAHQVMSNPITDYESDEITEKNEKWITIRENIVKAVSYLCITIIMLMFKWNEEAKVLDLFFQILVRISIVTSAMYSASKAAYFALNRKKRRLEIKIDLMNDLEEISYDEISTKADTIITQQIEYKIKT
jgi:hypothetical protein